LSCDKHRISLLPGGRPMLTYVCVCSACSAPRRLELLASDTTGYTRLGYRARLFVLLINAYLRRCPALRHAHVRHKYAPLPQLGRPCSWTFLNRRYYGRVISVAFRCC